MLALYASVLTSETQYFVYILFTILCEIVHKNTEKNVFYLGTFKDKTRRLPLFWFKLPPQPVTATPPCLFVMVLVSVDQCFI